MNTMWKDLFLQAVLFSVVIFMFLWMHNIPQNLYSNLRLRLLRFGRGAKKLEAKRHFVRSAQLLYEARTTKSSDHLLSEALSYADKAASLDPKDAATHILKALILELQGFHSSAIDSLDVALSPLAVKSLTRPERSDALCKRAELKLRGAPEQVDWAILDLLESVKNNECDNGKAYGVLGECYEKKGLTKEARKAYLDALKIQPNYYLAQQALDRLLPSSQL